MVRKWQTQLTHATILPKLVKQGRWLDLHNSLDCEVAHYTIRIAGLAEFVKLPYCIPKVANYTTSVWLRLGSSGWHFCGSSPDLSQRTLDHSLLTSRRWKGRSTWRETPSSS